MVKIKLRDDVREYENGITPYQIAEEQQHDGNCQDNRDNDFVHGFYCN